MSEEYRIEHRNHLMYVAGCPYCLKRAHDAGESPAPLVATDVGVFCLLHGMYDCAEPSCWRCGNHVMDEWQRCSDPRCRATNRPEVYSLIHDLKQLWNADGSRDPLPVELIAYEIGKRAIVASAGKAVGPEGEQAHPAPPPSEEE